MFGRSEVVRASEAATTPSADTHGQRQSGSERTPRSQLFNAPASRQVVSTLYHPRRGLSVQTVETVGEASIPGQGCSIVPPCRRSVMKIA